MLKANALEDRCYAFALQALKFCARLPSTHEAETIHRQLPRAATSTVAHYRAARRARSRREFVALLGKAVEEIDESSLWLRLSVDSGVGHPAAAGRLLDEARELLQILASSYATSRENLDRERSLRQRKRSARSEADRQITKSPNRQMPE